MIPVPPGVRVLVATRPVDFRKGADLLAALVNETPAQGPFLRRRAGVPQPPRRWIKIPVWDGSGLVLV